MNENNNNLDNKTNTDAFEIPDVVETPVVPEQSPSTNEVNLAPVPETLVTEPSVVPEPTPEVVMPAVETIVIPEPTPVVETPEVEKPELVEPPVQASPDFAVNPAPATPDLPVAPNPEPMVQTPAPEINVTPEPQMPEKVKKPKNKALIAIFAILLIFILGVAVFWYLKGDKIIFQKNVEAAFAKFHLEEKKEAIDSNKLKLRAVANIAYTGFTEETLSLDINALYQHNLEENAYKIDLDVDSDLLKKYSLIYIKDEKMYLSFDKTSRQLIEFPIEGLVEEDKLNLEFLNDLSSKNINTLSEYFNVAFQEEIDELEVSKEEVIVGGQTYKAKKITFVLDSNKQKNILQKFVKQVKEDEDLANLYAEFFVDLEEELEEEVDEDASDSVINYSVYLKGLTTLKHEIKFSRAEAETMSIVYEVYKNKDKNKEEVYSFLFPEQEDKNLIINLEHKTASTFFTIDIPDYIFTGEYSKKNQTTKVDLKALEEEQEIFTAKISYKEDKVSTLTLDLETALVPNDSLKINVTLDFEELKEEIKEDLSNAKGIDQLTEEELQQLYEIMSLASLLPTDY